MPKANRLILRTDNPVADCQKNPGVLCINHQDTEAAFCSDSIRAHLLPYPMGTGTSEIYLSVYRKGMGSTAKIYPKEQWQEAIAEMRRQCTENS